MGDVKEKTFNAINLKKMENIQCMEAMETLFDNFFDWVKEVKSRFTPASFSSTHMWSQRVHDKCAEVEMEIKASRKIMRNEVNKFWNEEERKATSVAAEKQRKA